MGDDLSIENSSGPNLPRRLFWDWRFEAIDWQAHAPAIIARVIERGSDEEWDEAVLFYGYDKIISALKNDITFLPDYAVDKALEYFHLQKEDLECYRCMQRRREHLS
ncbi:hypothetical protein [Paraflavitalea sp. CAU 1676]|uniref:DUF6922 domain-containing protein n=1 Tax=Paraflavitalea sp. CAU 1676 TaxID=3032598 RepID=UPI0023DC5FA3|nr:hypothetical protein [Paraflavitalea sp. CAU 1676]MDF2191361.1 hypothetical protein [Paraflavitalea sp. CAU 1676]